MPKKLLLLLGLDAVVALLAWLAVVSDAPSWVLVAAVVVLAILTVMEVHLTTTMKRRRE